MGKISNFMNSKRNGKMIRWLLKERVINHDGELKSDRLAVFKEKYDENITAEPLDNDKDSTPFRFSFLY
jgi:hypothetical protein